MNAEGEELAGSEEPVFRGRVQPHVPVRCPNCHNVGMRPEVEFTAEGVEPGTGANAETVVVTGIKEIRASRLVCDSCGAIRAPGSADVEDEALIEGG